MSERDLYAMKAAEAAARLERARVQGRQMSLLPAEATPADPGELEERKPGRPKGARNKRSSKLRQMLAARGYRMPEDVLAEAAGLGGADTGIELAMKRVEQINAWLGNEMTTSMKLGTFLAVLKDQTAAAGSLLPYGLEKMTPDQVQQAPVNLIMPGSHGMPGDRARVIDHADEAETAPPPMPRRVEMADADIERNQGLADGADRPSDGGDRTE